MTVGVLDDAWNFPLHLNVAASETEPFILHHHARLNDDLRLRQTSAAHTQEAIRRVNDAIASFQRQHGSCEWASSGAWPAASWRQSWGRLMARVLEVETSTRQ